MEKEEYGLQGQRKNNHRSRKKSRRMFPKPWKK